jgi:hypothetical protein
LLPFDTLGRLLALHVRAAYELDCGQVGLLAQQVQQITGQNVELVFVDQRYTGQAQNRLLKHGSPQEMGWLRSFG